MEKYEQLARNILESTCETDEIFEDYRRGAAVLWASPFHFSYSLRLQAQR